MDRRNFLKMGALVGTVAAVEKTRLIVMAADDEIARFGAQCDQSLAVNKADTEAAVDYGDVVFNHKGEPIGVIVEVKRTHRLQESSCFNDTYGTYVAGVTEVRYSVVAHGCAHVKAGSDLIRELALKARR